jgi:hypothetical protein
LGHNITYSLYIHDTTFILVLRIGATTEKTHFVDRFKPTYGRSEQVSALEEFQPESRIYKPRLIKKERVQALCSYPEPPLEQIVEAFTNWSTYKEYLIFKRDKKREGDREFKAVLSAKRGNAVYAWRLKGKFESLADIPEIKFFNYRDRSKVHKTSALFVTLTLAPGLRLDQQWEGIGEAYNRWISYLRRRYGRIDCIRVWEAHKSGVPHVHVILIFESKEFSTFFYNGTWRVQEKHDLEWAEGFTDVEALSSVKGGINYVVKYLAKLHKVGIHGGLEDTSYSAETNLGSLVASASTLTLSLMWAFRRRAFSVSRRLIDLIASMSNSNETCAIQTVQVDLEGVPIWDKWVLIGFWGGDLGVWCKELSIREIQSMRCSGSWSDNLRCS